MTTTETNAQRIRRLRRRHTELMATVARGGSAAEHDEFQAVIAELEVLGVVFSPRAGHDFDDVNDYRTDPTIAHLWRTR